MKIIYIILMSIFLTACAATNVQSINEQPSSSLKELYADSFVIGAALNRDQIFERVPGESSVIDKHFNTLTAENDMKWEIIHPKEDEFNFKPADRLVTLSQKNSAFLVGHTLLWHQQTPDWVFEDSSGNPASRELLLARMEDHISTIVSRYKGKVHGWDVVNEALNEDGSMRNSKWRQIIGDDYIEHAFAFAHAADPEAELYYNDYNMYLSAKRNGAIKLAQALKAKDLRIDGIGMQGHYGLDNPDLKEMEDSIVAIGNAGLSVMITELDLSVLKFPSREHFGADISISLDLSDEYNPYSKGLPETASRAQAERYAEIFAVFLKHKDIIDRVTFWGTTDNNSWKNNWPMQGRTDYALIFDRNNQPKLAFDYLVDVKKGHDKN